MSRCLKLVTRAEDPRVVRPPRNCRKKIHRRDCPARRRNSLELIECPVKCEPHECCNRFSKAARYLRYILPRVKILFPFISSGSPLEEIRGIERKIFETVFAESREFLSVQMNLIINSRCPGKLISKYSSLCVRLAEATRRISVGISKP